MRAGSASTARSSQAGWVEHDPAEVWANACDVIGTAIRADVTAADIAAIGITNQRETAVVGPGDGAPDPQRDRLADTAPLSTPSRTATPTGSARARGCPCDLLLRLEAALILDVVDGARELRRRGRARLRHPGRLRLLWN